MKNVVDVSIITVNYKVREKLFSCVQSIYDSKPKVNFEIIVVDNDEKKTIGNGLKNNFPKVRYIESKKNLGFGAGNNLGAKYAGGKYLFFLNPDSQVLEDSIDILYSFFEKNKKAGITSPLILNDSHQVFALQGYKELTPTRAIFSFSFLRKFFPSKTIFNNFSLDYWNKHPIKEVDCAYGAALMTPSEVFRKAGGFDENFFLYFEENDLSKRIKQLGYKAFINANSKTIHKVGQSTRQLGNIQKIFSQSRFYYLRKHYGIIKALLTESFLKVNKYSVLIFTAVILGLYLRIFNINNGMVFIGDQGWFYLSARDFLLHGNIPLVGITSSHTWLHQGPLWTYVLSMFLLIFKFNPISGAYATILSGVISIILTYKITSELFSQKTGIIAAFLYASSPLIILFDRMPFDPSLIPLFSLLYFYSLVKWFKGNILFFPFIIFLLAILYNLELATFTLFFPFALIFIYGFWKKKEWIFKLKDKKIFIYSFLAFLIPMTPIIIYDFSNDFKQTIVFFGWTIYKPFSFLIHGYAGSSVSNFGVLINFLIISIQKLIFSNNVYLSTLVFVVSIIYLIYLSYKKNDASYRILLFLLIVGLGGILVNQTPSDAYLPIVFPLVIIGISILLNFLLSLNKLTVILIMLIVAFNLQISLSNDLSNDLGKRVQAANKIIVLTKGKEYNLIGVGTGSQFESFTMNYEYLLWLKGNPPSHKKQKTKIVIKETDKEIIIKKYD